MSPAKVMVVDDNVMGVELVTFVMEDGDILVNAAYSAKEALAQIGTFLPDLILMDMHLPGMDGLQLTRLIKADPAMRHIVIIAFTASAMKDDQLKMMTAGCDGFLSKPIDVDTFAATVLSLMPDSVHKRAGLAATKVTEGF